MSDLTLYDCDELIKLVDAQAEKNEGELSESDWQLLVDAQTRSIEKLGKLVNYISLLDRFCDTADTEIPDSICAGKRQGNYRNAPAFNPKFRRRCFGGWI
jgi:hypothetical protein